MAAAQMWRWDPAFRIHRQPGRWPSIENPGIESASAVWSTSDRCWAACITSIRSRHPSLFEYLRTTKHRLERFDTDRAGKSIRALLKFRNIPNHPSHDRRVRNDHAALGHQRNEISVAQAIGDVPAHAQNNDLGVELALHIDRVTVLAFGHRASPSATSLADTRCCSGTQALNHHVAPTRSEPGTLRRLCRRRTQDAENHAARQHGLPLPAVVKCRARSLDAQAM